MRNFLHFVKKKIRINIGFMYTYCSHSDITSNNMIRIIFGVFQFSCKVYNIRYYSGQGSFLNYHQQNYWHILIIKT